MRLPPSALGAGSVGSRGRASSLGALLLLAGLGGALGCQGHQGQGAVESAGMLLGAMDPPKLGPFIVEGRVCRRSGVVCLPLAGLEVELVQDERVLAHAKADFDGRYHLSATIRNGTVEVRLAASPDVSTTRQAEWLRSPLRDVELVAVGPAGTPQ